LCLGLTALSSFTSWAATTHVSGGGSALQTAISAAAGGDELIVDDSLDYTPVDVGKQLFIHAAAGQTPRVVADPAVSGGMGVNVHDAGVNGSWGSINIVQNVAGGGGGHNVIGVFNAGATQTQPYLITNCTIRVDLSGGSVDARVMWLGANAHLINVTLNRNDNNGNPLIFIGDNGGNSTIENCTLGPSPFATAITDIASPAGQTLNVIGTTFTGLTGGRGITASDRAQIYNLTRCTFGAGIFAIYSGNSASTAGTVFNINQCKLGPAPANWLIFAGDGGGTVFNITNTVIFCDAVQGNLINNQAHAPLNNTWSFVHCTVTETQPGGGIKNGRQLLFNSGNSSGSAYFDNCLINWPGSASTAVSGSGVPVTAGINFVNVGSSTGDAFIGVGTQLTGDPQLNPDGYHLNPYSPCIDVGTAALSAVDIDGNARPLDAGFDIGCSEIHKAPFVFVSGGGTALATAISGAADGTYIIVQDSLDYGPVTVNHLLHILAASGQTPRVVADPAINSGQAVQVTTAGLNGDWTGISVIQNVAGGGGGHNVFSIDTGAGGTTYHITNSTISISGGSVDAKVLGLGDKTILSNVTLTRSDSNGNPIANVTGRGGDSTLVSCTIGPSAASAGLQNTANAGQKLTLVNCLFTGLVGRGIQTFDHPQTYNISGTTFSGPMFAIYANNAAGGPGTVYNINQSKLGPAPSDWLIFAGDGSGITFNFTNTVIFSDGTRDALISSQNNNSNNFSFVHCTFTETQPGGGARNGRKLVFLDTTTVGTFNFQNCLVNWPASQNTALVWSSGVLANPVVAGVNLVWVGSSSGDKFRGAGTEILSNPQMQPDGYHIKGVSPAIDAGTPNLTLVDIDGQTRPLNSGFDIGAVETVLSSVINVTGGANALQLAITGAQAGYDLVIQDSLNYGPVIVNKNITIEAAPGQTPTVVAIPAQNNGIAVQVTGAGTAATWRGINITQTSAGGGGGHNVLQLDQGAGGTTFNLQDCTVSVDLAGGNLDARVIGLGDKAVLNNVTVRRNDGNGNPLVMLYNNGQNSSFLNCTFGPTVAAHGIVDIASPGGTLTVSNCLFSGISSNNYAIGVSDHPQNVNVVKTTFAPNIFAIYAANAAAAASVWNVNQCFMGPAPANNQLAFSGDADGTRLNFTNVVIYAGGPKISYFVNGGRSNVWNFVHCTTTETGVGGGATPGRKFLNIGLAASAPYGNGTNGIYNFQNCIFNWPASTNIQIVGGAGLGIPPVRAGTNLVWVGGFNTADSFSGVGTQIIANPIMLLDGYHIGSISPAAAAGAPIGTAVDIDGNPRPATAPNPCLGATETIKGVLTHVTGGGGALQAAIDAASPGDWLQVDDSLDYTPILLQKLLTVLAGPGQHPRVLADPSVRSGTALFVSNAGDASTWIGIDALQTVGGGGGGHNVVFVANNGTTQVMTIMNCTIGINAPSDFIDARGSFFGNAVHLVNITFTRNDSTSFNNPVAWFGDNGGNSVCDNCTFGPTPFDAITDTASSKGVGLTLNNCHIIGGTGKRGFTASDNPQTYNLNNVTFDPGLFALYAGNSGSMPGTIWNVNRCTMGPPPNDWLLFAGDGSGAQMNFVNSVIFSDNIRGTLMYTVNRSNNFSFVHCTFSETQPNGGGRNNRILIQASGGSQVGTNSICKFQNCLFNWPGSTNTQVVATGGLGAVPVIAGTNLVWLPDTNANDAFRGAGAEIIADPQVAADGYTPGPLSPAIDAGTPNLTFVDRNGTGRPLNNGFDLGAVEVFRPAYVPPTILSIFPADGASNVVQGVTITVVIRDGTALPNPASYQLRLNGRTATPSSSKTGTSTTVTYAQPGGLLGNTVYTAIFTFADNSTPTPNLFTNTWTFSTQPPMDAAAPRLQGSDPSTLVVLEAIHFNRNTAAGGSAWQQVVADSPDTTAMQALPNVGRNVQANISLSPLMEYKVTFVTNGTHYIWAYGEADSPPGAGVDDTCNIGLDGVLPATGVGVGGSFAFLAGFQWNNARGGGGPIATLEVAAAGEHVVDVWMQKDGLQLNRILLTTDSNYNPNDTPPTESPLNPAQPRLTVQNTSSGLVITWTGGGTLYAGPTVTGPWSPVAGASGSINIDPSAPRQFYRVIR
jgi:hypothetical protein